MHNNTFDVGSEVVSLVNYFQPDEDHGFDWWPISGDRGKVVAVFELDNGDFVYDVEFYSDTDECSWTLREDEIIFEREY